MPVPSGKEDCANRATIDLLVANSEVALGDVRSENLHRQVSSAFAGRVVVMREAAFYSALDSRGVAGAQTASPWV
jgi:hypothetical protein